MNGMALHGVSHVKVRSPHTRVTRRLYLATVGHDFDIHSFYYQQDGRRFRGRMNAPRAQAIRFVMNAATYLSRPFLASYLGSSFHLT